MSYFNFWWSRMTREGQKEESARKRKEEEDRTTLRLRRLLETRRPDFHAPLGINWHQTAKAANEQEDALGGALAHRLAAGAIMTEDIKKHINNLSDGACPMVQASKARQDAHVL